MARSKRIVKIVVPLLLVIGALAPALADQYVGGATVVYKEAGQDPAVDKGVTVCHPDTGTGIGGGCIPFSSNPLQPDFVAVNDLARGQAGMNPGAVAFQVCLDTDGDMKCVSRGEPGHQGPCDDQVWFSHNDAGNFFNPLGPLPTSRQNQASCNPKGTGFNGYVVFLCEGAHVVDGQTHAHPSAIGTISLANNSPFAGKYGDYCGGIRDDVIKEYVIV